MHKQTGESIKSVIGNNQELQRVASHFESVIHKRITKTLDRIESYWNQFKFFKTSEQKQDDSFKPFAMYLDTFIDQRETLPCFENDEIVSKMVKANCIMRNKNLSQSLRKDSFIQKISQFLQTDEFDVIHLKAYRFEISNFLLFDILKEIFDLNTTNIAQIKNRTVIGNSNFEVNLSSHANLNGQLIFFNNNFNRIVVKYKPSDIVKENGKCFHEGDIVIILYRNAVSDSVAPKQVKPLPIKYRLENISEFIQKLNQNTNNKDLPYDCLKAFSKKHISYFSEEEFDKVYYKIIQTKLFTNFSKDIYKTYPLTAIEIYNQSKVTSKQA